jgi:hypothetical protein
VRAAAPGPSVVLSVAITGRSGASIAPKISVPLDETRNWGETERELLLGTDAEVVIGCWSQSAPDMCDSHTRTRQAKPADDAQSAAPPRAKAKRRASTSSVRPGAYARPSTVTRSTWLLLPPNCRRGRLRLGAGRLQGGSASTAALARGRRRSSAAAQSGPSRTTVVSPRQSSRGRSADGQSDRSRRSLVSTSDSRRAWAWIAYRAGRSMLVTGGQAPACETLVTRNPCRS